LKSMEPFLVVDSKSFVILDLVDENNKFHREIKTLDAIEIAQDKGLDLVCFSGETEKNNPLCKLIDYGKWKYQKGKKQKKQQKDQKHEMKEIRFTPSIDDHDVEHKMKHAQEFIDHGHELHFTMKIRRRVNINVAKSKMDEIVEKCSDFATVTSRKDEPRFISVKLTKNKENLK